MPDFEKNEINFINFLHDLQSEISDFFYDVAMGEDYDEDTAGRLFRFYKLDQQLQADNQRKTLA